MADLNFQPCKEHTHFTRGYVPCARRTDSCTPYKRHRLAFSAFLRHNRYLAFPMILSRKKRKHIVDFVFDFP